MGSCNKTIHVSTLPPHVFVVTVRCAGNASDSHNSFAKCWNKMADLEQDLNFDGETTIEDGVKVKSFKILQATCNVMPFGRFHLI